MSGRRDAASHKPVMASKRYFRGFLLFSATGFVWLNRPNVKISVSARQKGRTPERAIGGTGLEDDVEQWFAREILPLEPMLERYLRRNWRDQWEVPDLRQDAYVRVYEAALREKPFNPRYFLFQVARNLMIDRARRKNVVSIDFFADFDGMEADGDQPDVEQSAAARQEIRLLMTAIGELPPRCREVVTLRKIEGLSQREVARKMGITEDTVERQVSNGIRLLRKLLCRNHTPAVTDIRPRIRPRARGSKALLK